ncbi:hypothetical protein JWJ90_07395 [Desulfobulbus rhabdoformis]|uniref:hypothetical protein n=1 Tax=Desulfobulbus rhabdoformis TaxID=34032 RepID=UPI0019665B51|nr:hypothetical protein [Desulfobulbus rhabdoformis]MBM9614110.1 hypothetical protein [Desulfobulbus rhabdoformis]
MNGFAEAGAERLTRNTQGRRLPEYRELEMYTNSSVIQLCDPECAEENNGWNIPQVMDALEAFSFLDGYWESVKPQFAGLPPEQRFIRLEPRTQTERIMGQIYRILKIIRQGIAAPDVRIQTGRGLFKMNYVAPPYAFALHISFGGLEILTASIVVYLNSFRQWFPEAYLEAMLGQYYEDAANEIKYLSDEIGSVQQFRKKMFFNRHHRLRCGSARYSLTSDSLVIDVGPRYANSFLYPIDFFLQVDGIFHIIPAEALEEGKLPREQLADWQVRIPIPEAGAPEYTLRAEAIIPAVGPMY